MNWENRDNNIVEQTSIPKFSKLGDKGTLLRLFKLFFDDVLILGYTKLYGHREKADTRFETTNETFCLFLGMVLRSGCHKQLDCKIYWETIPDTLEKAMSGSMPCNTFERILQNLHLCGKEKFDK